MNREECMAHKPQIPIPIREKGIKFINKFQGNHHNGEAIRILSNEKRVCAFNDNEHKQYLRDQHEYFAIVILDDDNEGNNEDNGEMYIDSDLKCDEE